MKCSCEGCKISRDPNSGYQPCHNKCNGVMNPPKEGHTIIWEYQPVELLVLYTEGTKGSIKQIYGNTGVHYVNTKRMTLSDTLQGNRYKEILVFDRGVRQEDIELANKSLWRDDS